MSSPQRKKIKTGGTAGGAQRKRGPDQDLDVPTLGQVVEADEDFEPLRQLLEPVMNRPVSKLGQTLRAKLEEKGGEELGLLLASFFDECDARAKAQKRARAASEELSPDFHALLSVRATELGGDLGSVGSILEHFQASFSPLALSDSGTLSATSHPWLQLDIPLNTQGKPDMLRVALPATFPCHQRAAKVLETLNAGKHVFAAAVSGAGKTKLAFDVAQSHFSLYFDMNGGHGKVAQMDVSSFMEDCRLLNRRQDRALDVFVPEFEHLIGSLFLARWIVLLKAKERFSGLTPAQWLWMQTDIRDLSSACYRACVSLPLGAVGQLCRTLCGLPDDETGGLPIVEIDEAQKLLVHDHWFRSTSDRDAKRPLGYAVVGWLAQRGFACLCSGTNLRLKDFHAIRSAAGSDDDSWVMRYDFDYLDQEAVRQLVGHFLDVDHVDGLDDVLALLQGRPRFAAAAIRAAVDANIDSNGKGDLVQSILGYTRRMLLEEREGSIRALWKQLYADGGGTVEIQGAGKQTLWTIAFNMLVGSLFVPCAGDDEGARVTFPLNDHKEVVSRGVSMIQHVEGVPREFMAEPLVLSAGLTFCLNHRDIDIASDVLHKLSDGTTSDAQHRGKLLEFLIAARVFQSPARFMRVQDWPDEIQLPQHSPLGVLVGVPLTDPRLSFASLHETPAPGSPYWLGLPENQAGPDLVAPRMLFSMKSTSGSGVASDESKMSIKTTTPSRLYTKKNGTPYEADKWQKKHEAAIEAVAHWSAPIVRVRVELPAASQGTTPSNVVSRDGKWHCDMHDVNNSERRSDVMLYVSAKSTKSLLDFEWSADYRKNK